MIDPRASLKTLFESITYTDVNNDSYNINLYFETDRDNKGRISYKLPALIIRGLIEDIEPKDIGWNIYDDVVRVDISLYLKLRSERYKAYSVRDEVSSQIENIVKANAGSFENYDYLKLISVTDRDFLEEKGTLRRDFSLEVYKREV